MRISSRAPSLTLQPPPPHPQCSAHHPATSTRTRAAARREVPADTKSRSTSATKVASQNCCKYVPGAVERDGVGSLKSCKTTKEAYAVRRTVPPSAEIQAEIDKLLGSGLVDDPAEDARRARSARRPVDHSAGGQQLDQWLGRARYERRPERQRGLRNYDSGLRNGFRPRHVQTGEGELRSRGPASTRIGRAVRVEAVPEVALQTPAAHRPIEGAGDRRVRPWPIDE